MEIALHDISVAIGQPAKHLFAIKECCIASGSKILIEGPSGYGKTTLLHLLAGLMPFNSGTVKVGPKSYRDLSDDQLSQFRRDHIGMVFQKLNLLEHLTPLENVLLTLAPGPKRREHAQQALKAAHVDHLSDAKTAQLSLGEQQRVAVARVVARQPALILADEPTSSLDDANADAVMNALITLNPKSTVIVVSHDRRLRHRFKTIFDFERWIQ